MMTRKVFLKIIYRMFIIGIFLCPLIVWAQTNGSGIFNKAAHDIEETFYRARDVVYVVSGFGLIGIATAAIFGKLSFRWLAMICIALATLAAADKIVGYSIQNPIMIEDESRGIGHNDFNLHLQFNG